VNRACVPPRFERDENGVHVVCTRHADVVELLRHEQVSVDRTFAPGFRRAAREREHDPSDRSILVLDPPEHTRIRRLVSDCFTRRSCESFEPRLRELAHALVDAAGDRFDLVESFARPLPARVIAELLGLPAENHARFCAWSEAMTAPLVGGTDRAALDRAARAEVQLAQVLLRETAARRRDPRDDLISDLVHAEDIEPCLGDAELLAFARLLLVAGHETTTRAIAIGVGLLLERGEEWEALRRAPASLPTAVDELLRLATPIRAIARFASEDLVFGDAAVGRGARFTAWLDAANRDPEVFEDPLALWLDREPNPHLTFAFGIHFCLGAALARLEMRIALEVLLERLPELSLLDATPHWSSRSLVSDLSDLPVRASAN
jgi:cytochrome P450